MRPLKNKGVQASGGSRGSDVDNIRNISPGHAPLDDEHPE